MDLTKSNKAVGLTQAAINLLIAWPFTYAIIANNGGGFGFGWLIFPLILPLAISVFFGFLVFVDLKENYVFFSWLYISIHLIAGFSGVICLAFIPIFPYIVLPLIVSIILGFSINRDIADKLLLITNGLLLVCELSIVFLIFW